MIEITQQIVPSAAICLEASPKRLVKKIFLNVELSSISKHNIQVKYKLLCESKSHTKYK